MIKVVNHRVMLALILVISQMALSVHGFESHNPAEFTQCDLCVAQGRSDVVLVSAASFTQLREPYIEFPIILSTPALTADYYPAWTQRAPPGLN